MIKSVFNQHQWVSFLLHSDYVIHHYWNEWHDIDFFFINNSRFLFFFLCDSLCSLIIYMLYFRLLFFSRKNIMSNIEHTFRIPPVNIKKRIFRRFQFFFKILNSFVQFVNLLEVMNGLNQHLIQVNLVNFKNKLFQI